MSNLIRVDSEGNIQALEQIAFFNEVDDLQSYVRRNPRILGENVSIIAEQLDTGLGHRLDMLALEEIKEGVARPVIVELKNTEADTSTLLQVLRYANWALINGDSVRLHARQSKDKFKEIDNSSIKVIIVAPAIKDELLELSSYVVTNIDFGFLTFGRFRDALGDLLVLDWKTPATSQISRTTVQQEWNWDRYEKELKISPERIRIGKFLFDELSRLNEEKGWDLAPVFRKLYVPFKKKGYNVVLIDYWSKPCWLAIRLPKPPEDLGLPQVPGNYEQRYDNNYHFCYFKIVNTSADVTDFLPYILKSLELL